MSLSDRPDLETSRLLLRHPTVDDIDAIVKIAGDWEVARRLARVPFPYSADDANFFLQQVVPNEWVWAITVSGQRSLIGVAGLTPTKDSKKAELGYWLAPEHWGQGIVSEAAKRVVTFGFEELGLTAITSGYFCDNPASGRVLTKLGFAETGSSVRPCLAMKNELPSTEVILLNESAR